MEKKSIHKSPKKGSKKKRHMVLILHLKNQTMSQTTQVLVLKALQQQLFEPKYQIVIISNGKYDGHHGSDNPH